MQCTASQRLSLRLVLRRAPWESAVAAASALQQRGGRISWLLVSHLHCPVCPRRLHQSAMGCCKSSRSIVPRPPHMFPTNPATIPSTCSSCSSSTNKACAKTSSSPFRPQRRSGPPLGTFSASLSESRGAASSSICCCARNRAAAEAVGEAFVFHATKTFAFKRRGDIQVNPSLSPSSKNR